MKIIEVKSLALPEVRTLRFARFPDARGYFTESFRKEDFWGLPELDFMKGVEFVQTNESFSRPGVIRGLHFQWNPCMGKLVRTVRGRMVDLFLDIRKGSPNFGKVSAHDMPSGDEEGHGEWIWVPPGFAHGNFFTEETVIEYRCSGSYSPGCEAGISPLAKDLDWSLCDRGLKALFDGVVAQGAIISEKDANGLSLARWERDSRAGNFIYGEVEGHGGNRRTRKERKEKEVYQR